MLFPALIRKNLCNIWRQRWSLSAPACGSAKLNASEKNSNLAELLKQKCCKMNKTTYFITNFSNFM